MSDRPKPPQCPVGRFFMITEPTAEEEHEALEDIARYEAEIRKNQPGAEPVEAEIPARMEEGDKE